MIKSLLTKLRKKCEVIDGGRIAVEVNRMKVAEAVEAAEALLKRTDCWNVTPAVKFLGDANGIGQVNSKFFERYAEVHALFMSLQLYYIGAPDWVPKWIDPDVRIVGHTIENEFLICHTSSGEIFEFSLDDPQQPVTGKFTSIWHAVVFYHGAYGPEMS